jgi:hypothetical protein
MRALYNTMKADYPLVFRKNIVAPEVVATGLAFEIGAMEIKNARAERRSVNRLAGRAGVELSAPIKNPSRVREGLEARINRMAEEQADDLASDTIPAPVAEEEPTKQPAAPIDVFRSLRAQAEKQNPNFNIHRLMLDTIGDCPLPQAMTAAQIQKMIDALFAALRDSQKAAV